MTNPIATTHRRRSPLPTMVAAGAVASLAWAGAAFGADLPLTDITLYRSGVGSFTHNGKVVGNETIELDFGVERINDILKSMVLLDYSGGDIGGVNYEPMRSINDRLADFTIDPRQATSMAALLNTLRGEPIRLETADGDSVQGTVLGVESRSVTNPGSPESASEQWTTLLTGSGVRAVPLATVRSMDILNEDLAQELERGLAAMAEHRSEQRTSVDAVFNGEGERRVSVVYTHNAPVWKVSYRLVLPESAGDEPYLQGWAIVENDTDGDWEGVTLSLASGRPVSFVMDLQTPLNLHRPNVAVPVLAGIGPVMYESIMPQSSISQMKSMRSNGASFAAASENESDRMLMDSVNQLMAPRVEIQTNHQLLGNMGNGNATAGEAGEQFMYTIDAPVHIDRGESAMLPIMGQTIEGRRLTIFSPSTGVSRPMRGVELVNDTGLHLPPGPISVYDDDVYAGDAQIRHTSRDQERLLSYAVDLDVDVDSKQDNRRRTTSLKIVDGTIVETYHQSDRQTYTVVNRDTKRDRSVLIERPLMHGWKLTAPSKPDTLTKHAERYIVDLAPGETKDLVVEHTRTDSTRIAVLGYNWQQALVHQTNGAASQGVVDAIRKASQMQGAINGIDRQLAELDRERDAITQDQDRIRRNMNSVQRGTDLHTRYIQKLNEQESRIESIIGEREDLQAQREQTQRELNDYLRNLNVG